MICTKSYHTELYNCHPAYWKSKGNGNNIMIPIVIIYCNARSLDGSSPCGNYNTVAGCNSKTNRKGSDAAVMNPL